MIRGGGSRFGGEQTHRRFGAGVLLEMVGDLSGRGAVREVAYTRSG